MDDLRRTGRPFALAGWTVDPDSGELRRGDELRRLEPKVLRVLLTLAARRGDLVSKSQLLEEVWDGIAVSDDAVWRAIAALRRAFDDDPRDPAVVETVGHRGYRLVAQPEPAPRAIGPIAAPVLRTRRALRIAATFVVAVAGIWFVTGGGLANSDEDRALTRAVRGEAGRSADDFHRLGRVYYERRSEEDDRRALEQFRRAVQIDPEHGAAWADLANTLARIALDYRGGLAEADEAVAAAERAIALEPTMAAAHKALGYARTARFEIDAAIDAYRRALELDSGFEPAINNLAALLTSRGRYAEALEAFHNLQTSSLTHVVHLHNVGDALLHLGRLDAAREALDAALEIDPLQAPTIESRVALDLVEGRVDDASARVQQALAALPDAIPVRNAAANVALFRGDLVAAHDHLEHGVTRAGPGRNLGGRMRMAWIRTQLGYVDGAASLVAGYDDLLEAEVERRGQWRLAELRAELALAQGDPDAALEWFERAAALGHFDFAWRSVDPLVAELRDRPRFQALLDTPR